MPFQVAQNQRVAEMSGEGGEGMVEGGPDFGPGESGAGVGCRGGEVRSDRRKGTAGGGTRLGREPAGGLVEPRPDRRPPGSRSRLLGEEQEGGLEYVFGGVRVSDYSPGGPLDHSAVPADHLGERRFVVYRGEGVQQLGVGSGHDVLGVYASAAWRAGRSGRVGMAVSRRVSLR